MGFGGLGMWEIMLTERSLLYLAREYPFPLNSAARLRTFNWLLHLSKRFRQPSFW